MNGKTKYLALVVLIVSISFLTSYVTVSFLDTQNAQASQSTVNTPNYSNDTKTKVSLTAKSIRFDIDYYGNNLVQLATDKTVDNLTIVYRYTCLNGTVLTESVDYGRYSPSWGEGAVIDPGRVPNVYFRIPWSIIHDSSSTKTDETTGYTIWDVSPQVEVLEIYGYA